MIEPKGPDVPPMVIYMIIVPIVGFVGFLLLREVMHWYWRVNEIVDHLAAIRKAVETKPSEPVVEKDKDDLPFK